MLVELIQALLGNTQILSFNLKGSQGSVAFSYRVYYRGVKLETRDKGGETQTQTMDNMNE